MPFLDRLGGPGMHGFFAAPDQVSELASCRVDVGAGPSRVAIENYISHGGEHSLRSVREALDSQLLKAALITVANPWQMVDVHASVDSTNLEALRDPVRGGSWWPIIRARVVVGWRASGWHRQVRRSPRPRSFRCWLAVLRTWAGCHC